MSHWQQKLLLSRTLSNSKSDEYCIWFFFVRVSVCLCVCVCARLRTRTREVFRGCKVTLSDFWFIPIFIRELRCGCGKRMLFKAYIMLLQVWENVRLRDNSCIQNLSVLFWHKKQRPRGNRGCFIKEGEKLLNEGTEELLRYTRDYYFKCFCLL